MPARENSARLSWRFTIIFTCFHRVHLERRSAESFANIIPSDRGIDEGNLNANSWTRDSIKHLEAIPAVLHKRADSPAWYSSLHFAVAEDLRQFSADEIGQLARQSVCPPREMLAANVTAILRMHCELFKRDIFQLLFLPYEYVCVRACVYACAIKLPLRTLYFLFHAGLSK